MAKDNSYKNLSEIDYCIRQYFSKYLAPTLIKETRQLRENQAKEFTEQLQRNASPFVPVNVQLQNTDMQLKAAGKWYKKSSDDVIQVCKDRWGKDTKFAKDYQTFLNSFYRELVRRNGGKENEKLAEFAEKYVANRFQGLIIEQLAREQVPKSSAAYIAKKALEDSLLGLLPRTAPRKGELDDTIEKKAEDIYTPNALEKAAAIGGSMVIDAGLTGGYGSGSSLMVKGATKAGIKVGPKATSFLNSAWSGATIDGGLRTGFAIHHEQTWKNEKYAKEDSKNLLGDEDAIMHIQTGSDSIKHANTVGLYKLNSQLERKIKTSAPSFSARTKKDMDHVYSQFKNRSGQLLNMIRTNFSRQAIPFNSSSKVPQWMLKLGTKRCQQCASGFYSIAMEMSRERKDWISVGGKRMTLKQVSQRAYDYATAAVACEKKQASSAKVKKDSWNQNMDYLNEQINAPNQFPTGSTAYAPSFSPAQRPEAYVQPTGSMNGGNDLLNALPKELTEGWGNALKQAGLADFSDVTKNLGYVLAMLPDMIIGMFTGKNPNLRLEDNFLPLASIFGGLFVKNPLLKMLLLGLGGVNLLNNAGHAAIGQSKTIQQPRKTYKQYEEETLNPRITNPVIKGCSMIANIDGKPCVIGISENAIDAYEKGYLPLSTLSNAVLKKYDENQALAEREYDRTLQKVESNTKTMGIR